MNSFQWRKWFLFLIFAVYRRLDTVDGKYYTTSIDSLLYCKYETALFPKLFTKFET